MTFHDFAFEPSLADGLDSMGYSKPTPVQELAIPLILEGRDLIACAQTGTGKTAAYVLPVINRIIKSDHSHLNTLILAPTRELAQQIDQQIEGFAYFTPVSSIPIYGGGDGATWDVQKKALESGADMIIATPGRLIAQLSSSKFDFGHLKHLILDEADRMLDMGFFEDIMRIIQYLPKERQTLLFSATMPPKIRQLASRILNDPAEVNIAISKPAEKIVQQAYLAYDEQKTPLLLKLFRNSEFERVIIFCSTKESVKNLEREMKRQKIKVQAFHSDLEQQEREVLMRAFRNSEIQILIGTDVISRGIDVEGIDLVINYDVPPDPEDYIHRIGRTARAERTGMAITLVNPRDMGRFHRIESLIEKDIPKFQPPAAMGPGPEYKAGRGGGGQGNRRPGKDKAKR